MQIDKLFKTKRAVFSIEVFPPKQTTPIENIYPTLERLSALSPDFISVTYSAGGSGNGRTGEIASMLKDTYKVEPLAHLTCINSDRQTIDCQLAGLKKSGIENILALRGDKVAGAKEGEFKYASNLISHISKFGGFNIGAACYPEGHHESADLDADIINLKKKTDAGASHLISQLFFDNEDFYNFLDKCQKNDITVPIQAGIMPLIRKSQVERILTLTGVKIPQKLSRLLAKFSNDQDSLTEAGISYATDQIVDLLSYGVSGIHLYVMNNADVGERIINNIKDILRSVNARV